MAEACARLIVQQLDSLGGTGVIYVKSRWFPSSFTLSISDGLNAWICQGTPDEVSRKAFSWDYTVTQYLAQAKEHLDHQNPNCMYSFPSLPDGGKKLSWTLEKDGVQLIAHWKAEKLPNPQETTCDILDCLMSGSSRLSEELQRKTRSFERLKAETTRLVAQNLKFRDEKIQLEDDIYRTFVAVLNSKKAKLRGLRDLAAHVQGTGKSKGKDEMVEETESEDELDESESESENDDYESAQKKTREEAAGQASKVEDTGTGDNSAATEMHRDAPTADVSSYVRSDELSEEGIITDASKEQEAKDSGRVLSRSPPPVERTAVPNAEISSSKVRAEVVTDAATLLGGSTYNSAPRRRRR